jgi:GntR family transcriptional regulator
MTISKAYSLLEAEGLVERKRGIGLFVSKVKKGQMDRIKAGLLDSVLNKAAVTAIQLDVPEEEAVELFKKLYKEYDSQKRRQK